MARELLRAWAKAGSLSASSQDAETRVALRAAESLIAGARVLLAEYAAHPKLHDKTPCLLLITEALTVLKAISAGPESSIDELVAVLTTIASSLGRDGC